MMERRSALTLPFTVDKDKLMENPFKIPTACLSSECRNLERQVSWTTLTGGKFKHCKQQHKNGSMLFGHNLNTTLEMARRKPLLVLTDVLKTELGKAYIERIKKSPTKRENGQCREEPLTCRDKRTIQSDATNNHTKCKTPKHTQRTTSSSPPRSRLRRRQQNVDEEEEDEENKDVQKLITGMESREDNKFSEVVDCGLSVSWEPTEDTANSDFSPSIKERWSDTDIQHSLKRKRQSSGSRCNGTGSPKLLRQSVLRLTGEDGRDGAPAFVHISQEECEEDEDEESLDRCIVQFTVGGDEGREVLVPVITPISDFMIRRRLSSGQDGTTPKSPSSEPIVLSSDDEESGDASHRRSQAVHTLAAVEDAATQGKTSEEAVSKQEVATDMQDMQVLQVVVDEVPCMLAPSGIPSVDFSCMHVTFSTLHCGGYQAKENGVIMIADQKLIIPLKDTTEQVETILSFECKELRRYSVWEPHELEAQELRFQDDEEEVPPAAALLFFVSETAAAAVQRDLHRLCVRQDGASNTVKASPFILLTLRDPLEGMEGALLRSVLDIICLNSLESEQAEEVSGLEDLHSPVLTLEHSLELIKRTGVDSHLLCMLGLKSTDAGLNIDQDSSHSDEDPPPHIELEADPVTESVLKPETAPEQDTGTQLKPKEDQTEEELTPPTDKKDEPTPMYTLCHRRTKGSYSVSLCKPDSRWTKYKHQGLTHRLIQFPPPPLKGGITVTMEDLQCLDSGQYLNDVIIDFYLKYLLQKVPPSVAKRTHIFSSFFYKQLTRRDNASEGGSSDSCQRQRRHQRVKTWTRHVDIFKKDFLFVPVNQEAHWYLVVICFPGLDDPENEDWTSPNSEKSRGGTGETQVHDEPQGKSNGNAGTPPTLNRSDSVDTKTEKAEEESTKDSLPGPVNCTELTCQRKTVCKRPCILIMDSLKLSLHERVCKLLREYLQSEWEARQGSSREFGPDQMKTSHCKVPLQDNSSDCGLYLLQYVECFLKDPVVHFDLPLYLQRWFPRQQVRRKRDEIRDLIINLYRHQSLNDSCTKQLCS
ncbi:sentrin-specific protease 7 isoform X2 [Parambassis ranga]|uniref:Sentrin-specific protease 7 isoform X2 n=1 Tax=Parambassis ranga TaxID=210632 RepID=A0A6P7H7A2_9TELE|nr:sentrin-specific protease 7 isoform X2 [Parambassis ranga]